MTTDLAKLLFGGSDDKQEGTPAGADDVSPSPVDAWHSDAAPTVQTVTADISEKKVVAWINSHPPDLPIDQNNCAACGEYIHVYDTGWVCLGDGALIHYSDKHGKTCFDSWHQTRRDAAKTALNEQKGEINI